MTDLEQRLADELGGIATDLRTPDLSVDGLVAAGRRERVRRRLAAGVLAGAAAAVAVVLVAVVTPGGGGGSPQPAPPAPTVVVDDLLARPLELPWWAPDDGFLVEDGEQVVVRGDAIAMLRERGRTLIETRTRRGNLWSYVQDLGPMTVASEVSGFEQIGRPVAGPDGRLAHLDVVRRTEVTAEPPTTDVLYRLAAEVDDGIPAAYMSEDRTARVTCCDADGQPRLLGFLPDGRVLVGAVNRDAVSTWDPETNESAPVTGIPADVELARAASWPQGLAVWRDGRLLLGRIDSGNRWQLGWEIETDGDGVWSDDGGQYAELTDDGIRFSTEIGTTEVPLAADHRRLVGWESDSEVVVAQWMEADRAVTDVWRCDVVEARCAEVEDAPNGRVLLPGL